MVQELPRRTSSSGPAIIRLLARLNDADILEPRQPPPDRLSQWLGWSDAIALAATLNGSAPAIAAGVDDSAFTEEDYERVKAELERAIAGVNAPPPRRQRGHRPTAAQGGARSAEAAEFATYRRRYIALQEAMETRIADLRRSLRGVLACGTAQMAGLAGLDAVLEQALNDREYRLLAGVPALLETRFERLRRAAQVEPDESGAPASDAWLDAFDKDMRGVLLAELNIRLQPLEGLLAALRAC
ncbi:MAG: DUF3348 domain-containing protein [Burkholderiaceae bacterium]